MGNSVEIRKSFGMFSKSTLFFILFVLLIPNYAQASFLDSDGDGLSDRDERYIYFTDPENPDSDGDGYDDGLEVRNNYPPASSISKKNSQIDSDRDGLNDDIELKLKTNIMNKDTDGDGYEDGLEVFSGYNPNRNNKDSNVKREVKVDISTQKLGYYLDDILIKEYPVSTGRPSAPSPTGEFTIQRKLPIHIYPRISGGYFTNVKWNLQFKPHYYIHSAYWHNDFGIKARSGGCVNLKEEDAEVIYSILRVGDKVRISGKTPVNGLVQ